MKNVNKQARLREWNEKVSCIVEYWKRCDASMSVSEMRVSHMPSVIIQMLAHFSFLLYTWHYYPDFSKNKTDEVKLELSEDKSTFVFKGRFMFVSGITKTSISSDTRVILNSTKLSVKCVKMTNAGYIGVTTSPEMALHAGARPCNKDVFIGTCVYLWNGGQMRHRSANGDIRSMNGEADLEWESGDTITICVFSEKVSFCKNGNKEKTHTISVDLTGLVLYPFVSCDLREGTSFTFIQ